MAREIRVGDTFTIWGTEFLFVKVEDDTIVFQDTLTGARFIYGLEAFRRVARGLGYEVIV